MCCTFGRGDTVEYRQKTQEFVKKNFKSKQNQTRILVKKCQNLTKILKIKQAYLM